jgi:hypothetical protein
MIVLRTTELNSPVQLVDEAGRQAMAEFDPMKFFALWMFTHDQADDLMVQSVERGRAVNVEGMSGGPDAFTDGFMAMVAEEKARLKEQIASGNTDEAASPRDERLDEVCFQVAELRGRLDQTQVTLDAIAAHVGMKGA